MQSTLTATFLLVAGGLPAFSQSQNTAAAPTVAIERPTVTATRVVDVPRIDGLLDDPAWRLAAHITKFVQQRPVEGAPATDRTDIYIAYDAEKLYVGVYAHYTDPRLIRANRVDRDQTLNDDTVTVFLDPFLDRQRGYAFSVNAYGVQADAVLGPAGPNSGQSPSGDSTWNALYQSAGTRVEDGWTAEMAIPIKSLRYPKRGPGEEHRWGFQILREIKSKDETVSWSPISTNTLGFLPQMGVLEGLHDLSSDRNIEVMPTVTAIQVGKLDSSGRFTDADVQEGGINFKYGIRSNLTLDLTFNPDFSQIESDLPQIDINQRYPLQFAELRPFFLEGNEIYQIPGPVAYVHTRTVLDPKFGSKLTGKIGKAQVAMLITNDEAAERAVDPHGHEYVGSSQIVIARAKYEIYRESHIGALGTAREFLNSYSRLALVDGSFRLGRSARYGFRVVTSDRRDLQGARKRGAMIDIDFRKEGRRFSYFGAHNEIHPDFGTDLGFVARVDQKQTLGTVSYRWWPARGVVSWGPAVRYERYYKWNGTLTDENIRSSTTAQFAKSITTTVGLERNMEQFLKTNFHKRRFTVAARINSSRRLAFAADFNHGDEIRYIAAPYLGSSTGYNATLTLRPGVRFQSQIGLNATRFLDVRSNAVDFDVTIIRALTTYQFTSRLLIRNIMEVNTLKNTFAVNVLATYRVNAGTVFFVGYDDRYQQDAIVNQSVITAPNYMRTNRAVFTKLQYLYRY